MGRGPWGVKISLRFLDRRGKVSDRGPDLLVWLRKLNERWMKLGQSTEFWKWNFFCRNWGQTESQISIIKAIGKNIFGNRMLASIEAAVVSWETREVEVVIVEVKNITWMHINAWGLPCLGWPYVITKKEDKAFQNVGRVGNPRHACRVARDTTPTGTLTLPWLQASGCLSGGRTSPSGERHTSEEHSAFGGM